MRGFRGVGGVPRFIERAQGSKMQDVDGNSYIDYCQSWGPLILGHRDPEVREAVLQAIDRGWSFGAAEPYSLELAEFIRTELPWVEKIRFVSSGTEAVLSALRLARAATGRSKILKFDGCYHGHVDSLLVRAGSGLADMASPDSAGVSEAVAAETVVVPLDDPKALARAFELHGSEIAAAIVEPVPANNGLLPHAPGFLKGLIELAHRHGALVIFDEVITGFRLGFGGYGAQFAASASDAQPDLYTYGKVIAGGFPVGAYGGRKEIMALIAPEGPVYQAGTLSANPVSMVAGLATLKKLKRELPYAALEKKTRWLGAEMTAAAEKAGVPFHVQSEGSIFWGVFGTDQNSGPMPIIRDPAHAPAIHKPTYSKVFHALLDRGVYLAPSAYEVGFLSTAHTDEDLDQTVHAFSEALKVLS